MPEWTTEQTLAFNIGYALSRVPVHRLRHTLTEDERERIARHIVEHLKLCGWTFVPHRPTGPGHGTGRGGASS